MEHYNGLRNGRSAGGMMHSAMGSLRERLRHQIKAADVFFLLAAIPILSVFAFAPETFGLSWAGFGKLGRGGLLFVLFFLGFELMDFRKTARSHLNRARKVTCAIVLALALIYFGGMGTAVQFTDFLYWIGKNLGVAEDVKNSWLMAVDYSVLIIYLVALGTLFFGRRAILQILTAIVFSTGMVIVYVFDSFFPYSSIGPLQFWANFVVAGVAFLSSLFALPVYGYGNVLNIVGKHGLYRLIVFWPSVGVHSMLIYSLVMILLAAKLDAPSKRKLIYAAAGVAGTVLLNITRIFLITYYAYAYATSSQNLDAFHNSIGELLLPVWILGFLVIVLNIEQRLSARIHDNSAMRAHLSVI